MYSNRKMKEIVYKTAELLSSADNGTEITTRKIAENAGINPAMVNYYFGSKDNLLKAAVSAMEGDHSTDAAHDQDGSRKAMFDLLIKMCGTYILYSKLGLNSDTASFSKDVLEASSKLIEMKKVYSGTRSDEKGVESALKIVCFLMTASANPEGFAKCSGIDVQSKNQLKLLVSKQLDILLGEAL